MSRKKPSRVDILVGKRIRIERMARGISQTALGEKIGVTFQQVQKYEKGINRVGAGRLNEIAAVLGLPVSAFFDGAGGRSLASQADDPEAPLALLEMPGAIRLLRAYASVTSQALRNSLIAVAETAARKRSSKSK